MPSNRKTCTGAKTADGNPATQIHGGLGSIAVLAVTSAESQLTPQFRTSMAGQPARLSATALRRIIPAVPCPALGSTGRICARACPHQVHEDDGREQTQADKVTCVSGAFELQREERPHPGGHHYKGQRLEAMPAHRLPPGWYAAIRVGRTSAWRPVHFRRQAPK